MTRCIQISPYILVQGEVIARNPFENTATIKCNGRIWTGRLIPVVRNGEAVQ